MYPLYKVFWTAIEKQKKQKNLGPLKKNFELKKKEKYFLTHPKIFFGPSQKKNSFYFFFIFIPTLICFLLHGNGDTIRIGQETKCLPYAGFHQLVSIKIEIATFQKSVLISRLLFRLSGFQSWYQHRYWHSQDCSLGQNFSIRHDYKTNSWIWAKPGNSRKILESIWTSKTGFIPDLLFIPEFILHSRILPSRAPTNDLTWHIMFSKPKWFFFIFYFFGFA